MKTKNLLSHLSELESSLNNFAYSELSSEEASLLKETFLSFKKLAEAKIWGEEHVQVAPGQSGKDELGKELQLVAAVSHEMRTSVNSINDFAERLKDTELSPEQEYHVDGIASVTGNVLDTLNELLEYTRLSAGLDHFESVPFNFHNLVKEVSYLCKTLIVEKSVNLDIHLDPAIPKYVKGDPSRITQLMLSLVGNAIAFVNKGAVSLHMTLTGQAGNSLKIGFVVSDTGIGIPESDLEHIFTSFRQAGNATYRYNGSRGLGLAIVKQLVVKLGGEIKVDSTLGQGTTFTFVLPFEKAVMPYVRTKAALVRNRRPSSINKGLPPDGNSVNIDLGPMLDDCLGKVEILENLVEIYKQNALEFIGTVKVCLAKSDFEGIAFAAHKTKCAIKMFGTENLSFLLEQIYRTSRINQDIRHLGFLHNCFLEEYPLVAAAMDLALAELKNKGS